MDFDFHKRKPQEDIPTDVIIHYIVKDYRRMFLNYDEMKLRAEKAEAKIAEQEAEAARKAVIDNLKKASEECTASGTSLAADGMSLMIDAKDKNDTAALLDLYSVMETLNLPDSLLDDMGHTTAMMGKQTQTCGDYEVSWAYHPDNGLDVLIKIIQ